MDPNAGSSSSVTVVLGTVPATNNNLKVSLQRFVLNGVILTKKQFVQLKTGNDYIQVRCPKCVSSFA